MNFFGLTDKGKLRRQNQDFLFASDVPVGGLPNLFVVADGMGGHNAGEVASEYAVDELLERLRATDDPEPVHAISDAVSYANAKVYEKAGEDIDKAGMGTTMVTCVLSGKHLSVSNVGDSRLYLFDGTLTQITKDHSLVEEMVRLGELTREEARTHPDRNIITRAVGAAEDIDIDFFDYQLSPDAMILMCTDGLTNMVDDREIRRILSTSAEIGETPKILVNEANENGGKDNIAVLIISPDADEV